MAGSINKVILVGNLGADPELRRLSSGDPVTSFSIATSESWKDRQTGEKREKTEWHNIVIFNEALAKFAESYLRKGHKVYIEGQLQTRKWQDKDGRDRYTTEIVLQKYRGELQILDSRSGSDSASNNSFGSANNSFSSYDNPKPAMTSNNSPAVDFDDDIPF